MSMFKVEDQITTTGFLLQRPFHIFQRPQPYRSFWWRQFGKYFHPPWPLSDRAEVVICVSEANCNIYLGLEFLHAHGKVIVICCFTSKGNCSQFRLDQQMKYYLLVYCIIQYTNFFLHPIQRPTSALYKSSQGNQ